MIKNQLKIIEFISFLTFLNLKLKYSCVLFIIIYKISKNTQLLKLFNIFLYELL